MSPGQNATQEVKLVPIKLCHPTQELGNYTPKKPISLVLSGVFEQFGTRTKAIHWPSPGAKLWPFKGAMTGVFIFSRGVTYSEYLSWHVANTTSLLTAILIINRCPPPVLGHHPFLVFIPCYRVVKFFNFFFLT